MWIVFLICGITITASLVFTLLKSKHKGMKVALIVIASVFCLIVAYLGGRELAREEGRQAAISDLQKADLSNK